ncbi:MAG: hypothetical protein ACTHMV_13615 [Chitinophagaceae bacterium]
MTRVELNRLAYVWLALAMLLLSSCNVLKEKWSKKNDLSKTDTSSVQTDIISVKKESGSEKENSKYEKEMTIIPTLVRDTINNTVKVYPKTYIREKGEVQKEYIYLNSDSTKFEKLEQALSTLTLAMAEQYKYKKSITPWYVWVALAWAALCSVAIIYLIIRKK